MADSPANQIVGYIGRWPDWLYPRRWRTIVVLGDFVGDASLEVATAHPAFQERTRF